MAYEQIMPALPHLPEHSELREEGWIRPSDKVLVNLTGGMRGPSQPV